MKKAYITPASVVETISTEAIIAASLTINDGEAEQWSNKKGSAWDSANWSASEEDE